MNIQLTKHPERKYGMGLSMNFGGPTPPPPPYRPKVQVTLTGGTTVVDYFDNNTIPAGYYSGRTDIYSVHIWSGMTIGGQEVFKDCTNLNYAIVNGGGTIVAHCFQGCTKMLTVSISNRYTRLEGWIFSGCTSLSSVTIPDSVTLIGGYTFQDCTNLEEVVLGSGMTQINIQCFKNTSSLTSITCLATTAPTLGNNVFQNIASDGTLYVPTGSDYSTWVAALPVNWTVSYI